MTISARILLLLLRVVRGLIGVLMASQLLSTINIVLGASAARGSPGRWLLALVTLGLFLAAALAFELSRRGINALYSRFTGDASRAVPKFFGL